jgi:lysophospholipase L1-like esterase
MKKNKSTRRHFLVSSLLAGTGAGLLPLTSLGQEQEEPAYQPNEKDLVFLFQGDSITDGNRGRNADPNHIMGHGYAFSIASRVGADFPAAGFSFHNRGISGNTVSDLQQRWQEDTLRIQPDILSILIGINDVNAVIEEKPGALTADEFEDIYRQLLKDMTTVKPGVLFVLGLPFVYGVGKRKENWNAWKEETLRRSNRVKKLAKEFNAILIDYPAVFDNAIKKAPVDYWIWDGIHPTVPAHELMARAWIRQASQRLHFLKKYISGN